MNTQCNNTDKEIWRECSEDYYSPSIHITETNGIGINIGGHVIVKSVYEWFNLAKLSASTSSYVGLCSLPEQKNDKD